MIRPLFYILQKINNQPGESCNCNRIWWIWVDNYAWIDAARLIGQLLTSVLLEITQFRREYWGAGQKRWLLVPRREVMNCEPHAAASNFSLPQASRLVAHMLSSRNIGKTHRKHGHIFLLWRDVRQRPKEVEFSCPAARSTGLPRSNKLCNHSIIASTKITRWQA